MPERNVYSVGILYLGDGKIQIRSGDSDTRQEIIDECDDGIDTPAKGSVYLSSAGEAFLRVNNAGAATDWEKVDTSASD